MEKNQNSMPDLENLNEEKDKLSVVDCGCENDPDCSCGNEASFALEVEVNDKKE